METLKIKVGEKSYTVKVAESDEEKQQGLQNLESLPEDEGMLFVFDSDGEEVSFWMEDTSIPLDIIYINSDLEVTNIFEGIPYSKDLLTGEASYVLEVNKDSGIKVGDELDFESKEHKASKMLVLDSEGNPQMELDGGERIFSRKHTKTLIKFANKASLTGKDNDYRALGKRMFKFLGIQDETDPEYVQLKTN